MPINRNVSDEKRPISRRRFIKRGVFFGLAATLVGDAFAVEPNDLTVERIEVPIRGLGRGFDGYRIALFSDIHFPRNIGQDYVHHAVDLANAFDPDLIAVPGDLLHGRDIDTSRVPDLSGLYDGLRARDGIVATFGNHDNMYNMVELRKMVRDHTPLEDLENRHRVLRRGADELAIGGVEDLRYGKPDPVRAFDGLSPEVPRVLLSHNPDVAEDEVWPTRVDLQISGHTHGGEVRIPFGPAPFIPSKYGQKFRAGLVEGRSHRVYVTRGIGSPVYVRFCCPPEMTYLTLRAA